MQEPIHSYVTRLREARGAELGRKYSQRELARRAGLAPSTIFRLEGGKHAPSVETLTAVAPHIGTTVDDLLKRAGYRAVRPKVEEAEAQRAENRQPPGQDDPVVVIRRDIARLPMKPASRSAILHIAEELSKAADDDCRVKFEDAVQKLQGRYAAADHISPEEWLQNYTAELRYYMFNVT